MRSELRFHAIKLCTRIWGGGREMREELLARGGQGELRRSIGWSAENSINETRRAAMETFPARENLGATAIMHRFGSDMCRSALHVRVNEGADSAIGGRVRYEGRK